MKRLTYLLLTGALLLLLSSCTDALNSENLVMGINPNPIGFEYDIDDDGAITFTIPSHTLTLHSRSGAIGATVEGYSIEYYDSSGNPLFIGDHVVNSQGSLNIYVPPGLTCTEPLPTVGERVLGCRFDSPGVRYAPGPEVSAVDNSFLPITIASEDFDLLFSGGAVGAYADLFLYGTNDLGNTFRTDFYRINIITPLGG